MKLSAPIIVGTLAVAGSIVLLSLDRSDSEADPAQEPAAVEARPDTTSTTVTAIRHPDPTLARIPQGSPTDLSRLPVTPITPWDDSGLRGWIEKTLAKLETGIDDAEVKRLGQEAAAAAGSATDTQAFYRATNSAIPFIYESDDPEDHRKGLYILLKAASSGRDEPFTFMRLGGYLEEFGELNDAPFAPDAYRVAADRDFLPAIINLAIAVKDSIGFPPDDLEAYLLYGLDLNADDGGWNILSLVQNFYIFDQPDRDPKDRLQQVVARYRDYGDEPEANMLEFRMYLDGRGVDPDPEQALAAAKRALSGGYDWVAGDIGYIYQQTDSPLYDRDLSRDYLVACLDHDPQDFCAVNLAVLYAEPNADGEISTLAVAFYKYALELDTGGDSTTQELARERFGRRFQELNANGMAQVDVYYQAISAGDYSAIPHLKDARPVPELAEPEPASN